MRYTPTIRFIRYTRYLSIRSIHSVHTILFGGTVHRDSFRLSDTFQQVNFIRAFRYYRRNRFTHSHRYSLVSRFLPESDNYVRLQSFRLYSTLRRCASLFLFDTIDGIDSFHDHDTRNIVDSFITRDTLVVPDSFAPFDTSRFKRFSPQLPQGRAPKPTCDLRLCRSMPSRTPETYRYEVS